MTDTRGLSDEALFIHEGSPLSQRAFVDVIRAAGLREGDACLVHFSILPLGRPAMPKDRLLDLLVEAFEHVLGTDGTLIMPTYTFSFCNNEVFDVEKSKSTCGALTEYFRLLPGVVRSIHPIYSHAMRGPDAAVLAATNNRDCFGKDTFFGKLYELDGKTMTFGSGFASTFKHHVEQAHGVPYRYFKTFSGKIVEGERECEATCTFYVRRLEMGWVKDSRALKTRMVDRGPLKLARLGGAEVTLTSARDLYEQAWQMLDEDVYSLMKKKDG